MKTFSFILLPIILFFLSISNANANGGFSCRRPIDKFEGAYNLYLVSTEKDQVIFVKNILSKLREKSPEVYLDSKFRIEEQTINELQNHLDSNSEHNLYIGIGQPSFLKQIFKTKQLLHAVSLNTFEKIETNLSKDDYYRELLTHAIYRGLLQLNLEEQPKVSEVTLEHALGKRYTNF